jgi:predicted nucleic acid-binding protein
MRFWDSSALVPLLVREPSSTEVLAEFERDSEIIVWWATEAECASALARLEREGSLASESVRDGLLRLAGLADAWHEVQPISPVLRTAIRLLRVHDLPAGDALQLSAAITAAAHQPDSLALVTLDDRLARAAEREGFPVIHPARA